MIEQEIEQRISRIRRGFQRANDRRVAFERVLRDHYEHLRSSETVTREYVEKSLVALHGALNQPELVEQQLLIDYIAEVVRCVGNVGLGYEFGEAFVDRAIEVYRQAEYSLTSLYLVKAHFLPFDEIEHPDRERLFLEAKHYAQEHGEQEGLARVLLEMSEYYTTTSHYQKALTACKECEHLIKANSQLQKYSSSVLANLGINYFSLLDLNHASFYLLQAYQLLTEEITAQSERGDPHFGKRVLATVLHYLGRVAEMKGELRSALQYYVEGHRYQQMAAENPDAIAFYHLRMGELLTSASLFDQAREHLEKSQEMINDIVIVGTARIQLRLAWAVIYNHEGDYRRARECIQGALDEARQKQTSRVELYCLLKLFRLEIRHMHLQRALYATYQIAKTLRDGELSRNGAFLPARLLVSLKFVWRSAYLFLKDTNHKPSLQTCTCPIHQPAEVALPIPPAI